MANQKVAFNGAKFLEDNGMTLIAPEEGKQGMYRVQDAEGNQQLFDATRFIKDQGLNPAQVVMSLNTMDSATEISPLGLTDRARMSLGNEKGKLNFLRSKFEDVKYSSNLGKVVVKNQGVWQQVDPDAWGEGSAWDRSKEILADVMDLGDIVPGLVAAGAGAAKGAAAGATAGPMGALAGAAAGAAAGGGGAETIRTSLGRLAGTYEASAGEQLKDIGWEALLNAGGEFVGPALKLVGRAPGVKELGSALKNIATKASDVNKDVLAQTLGRLTGAGDVATRTAIDQSDEVVAQLNRARAGAASISDVVGRLKDSQLADVEYLVDNAQRTLSTRYGELQAELVNQAGSMGKIDMAKVVDDSLESMAQAGLLKRTVTADTSGKVMGVRYAPMDEATAAKMIDNGQAAQVMVPKLQRSVRQVLSSVEAMRKLGTAEGKEAANRLLTLRKSINQIGEQVRSPDMPPMFDKVLTQVEQAVGNRVGAEFSQAGLAAPYAATSNLYQKFGSTVATMNKLKNQMGGPEMILNRIVSGPNANRTFKGFAADLADLYGPTGREKLQAIYQKHAAEKFSDYLPRTGMMPAVGGAAAAAGLAYGEPEAAGALALAMSPRAALKAVSSGNKALGFLKGLTEQQRAEFLVNPNAVRTMFQIIDDASSQEDAAVQALTQQALGGR